MATKFIGRKAEIQQLEQYFSNGHSNLVVIKGRRRIGKSRLVEEVAKNKKFLHFIGIAPENDVTAQDQREEFARRLKRYFPELPSLKADDWAELFEILSQKAKTEKIVILLDEISWMAADDPTFLGKLKNAWDEFFKKNDNLMLICCGSISSWLDENLLSSTNFVGRVHLVLTLKELSIKESRAFLASKSNHLSNFDQLKYLSVTGGIPLYLENFDARLTVDDNIKQLCFSPSGILFREFDNIFHDLFNTNTGYYKKITHALVNGPLSAEDICSKCGIESGGTISKYLYDLSETGFITRDYVWAFGSGKAGKLSRYRLSDNYIRFYLHYIDRQKVNIEKHQFQYSSVSQLPGWQSIMGLQLENLVLNNKSELLEMIGVMPHTIVNDGPYFQKGTSVKKGCQIDWLIQNQFNNLFVVEVKCSRNEINKSVITEVKEKLECIQKPKSFSTFPVLITAGDVSDSVYDAEFFVKIIDLRAL